VKDVFRLYRREFAVFGLFFTSALIIVVLHLLFHPVRMLGMDTSIFYMDEKYTLAAFFSTVTAFLIGFLVLTNLDGVKSKIRRLANLAYGLFFIGLALDEYFEIHEYANTLIKAGITDDGIIKTLVNLSWVFPLSLVILLVFGLFLVKWKQSGREVRLSIAIGAFCFAVVLIFELLGSATYGRHVYVYFVAIEEGMEMVGTTFFLLAALIESRLYKNEPSI
jgi:hypothetical protein